MFRNLISSPYPVIRRFITTFKYGMTEEELEHLRAAWKVVNDAPIPVGKIFFKLLFEKHPEYQKYFRLHGSTHKGNLLHNRAFIWHIKAVTSTLVRIISRFEDEKGVDQAVTYVAKSHAPNRQKIGRKEMEDMGIAVKEALRTLNKAKWTKDSEAAFDKFYKGFVDQYVAVLSKEEGKIKPTFEKDF